MGTSDIKAFARSLCPQTEFLMVGDILKGSPCGAGLPRGCASPIQTDLPESSSLAWVSTLSASPLPPEASEMSGNASSSGWLSPLVVVAQLPAAHELEVDL